MIKGIHKQVQCALLLTLMLVLCSGVVGASEDTLVFGTIVPTQVNQFMVYYAEFQKKVAEELGVELIVLDSQDSGERQLANIEDLIARKVDGIVFLPYWGTGQAGFEQANRCWYSDYCNRCSHTRG